MVCRCVVFTLSLKHLTVLFYGSSELVMIRDCSLGIPAVFANPESQDWRRLNPGISGLQKFVMIALFGALNA